MSDTKLDSRIKKAGELSETAFIKLNRLQTGKEFMFKTGKSFIDCHIGGVLPSDVILIGAPSGVGKTKMMYDLLDSILDINVNKDAQEFVSLDYALELPFLNRILRDSNKLLDKKKTDILHNSFTPEEAKIMKEYHNGMQDSRRFVCEESINTRDFFEMTSAFCQEHKDKKAIIVNIDHLLLVLETNSGEDVMKTLAMHVNNLRKMYHNVYFILLSQFNRSAYQNVQEKSNAMTPTVSMIYGSSHFEFLSSFIIAMIDPFKMGVNDYMKTNRSRYDWLEEFMTVEDNKDKVSFNTLGNIFVHTLKTRESDQPYHNLDIIPMTLSPEQIEKMKQGVETVSVQTIVTPTFTPPSIADFAHKTLNNLQGEGFDKQDEPF